MSKPIQTCQYPLLTPNRLTVRAGARIPGGLREHVSKSQLRRHIEQTGQSPDPFGITTELAVARGLLRHKLDAVECAQSVTSADLASLWRLIDTVSVLIDRMTRAHDRTAFTKTELKFITEGMQSLLDEFVPDPQQRRAFLARLRALVPR